MSGITRVRRPFKIWDENAKRDLPWRCYKTYERAVEKCLVLLYWLAVGNSYTIYDERNGKAKRQFTRFIEGIKERKE